jgi:hypothetical protein
LLLDLRMPYFARSTRSAPCSDQDNRDLIASPSPILDYFQYKNRQFATRIPVLVVSNCYFFSINAPNR